MDARCSRMGGSCLPTPRKGSHRPRSKYRPISCDLLTVQSPRSPGPQHGGHTPHRGHLLHSPITSQRLMRPDELARRRVGSRHHPLVSSRPGRGGKGARAHVCGSRERDQKESSQPASASFDLIRLCQQKPRCGGDL
jgi:hypothetical protein